MSGGTDVSLGDHVSFSAAGRPAPGSSHELFPNAVWLWNLPWYRWDVDAGASDNTA